MRVLVTGATGFIGTQLVSRLLHQGDEVVCLVRDPAKLSADVRARVTVLRGDLGIFRDANLVLPEVDVVVHLAAVVAGKDQAEYAAINFEAVKDLVSCVARQSWRPRRFLFASSLAAAGPNRGPEPHREEDDARPIDAYGQAKADAEALLRAQPFATTCFRPPIVLGPGDPASITLFKMARSGFAFLPAGAPQQLSFVAVSDLVEAILAMAGDRSSAHQTYYASSEETTTNRALLIAMSHALSPHRKRALRIVSVPKPLLVALMHVATAGAKMFGFKNQLDEKQLAQMTAPSFVCTSAKLTRDTGWKAKLSLERTLAVAVEGYRSRGEL